VIHESMSLIYEPASKLNCSNDALFDHLAGVARRETTGYSAQVSGDTTPCKVTPVWGYNPV